MHKKNFVPVDLASELILELLPLFFDPANHSLIAPIGLPFRQPGKSLRPGPPAPRKPRAAWPRGLPVRADPASKDANPENLE